MTIALGWASRWLLPRVTGSRWANAAVWTLHALASYRWVQYMLVSRYESAEQWQAYQEALRIQPEYENGYFGVGLAYEALGDGESAEQTYREGLRRNPRSLPLAYRLARILAESGRPEAHFAWRRALAIEPRSAAAREGLRAWTLRELSARDRAASEGKEAP